MIAFDPKLLTTEFVQLKTVSTAMGGGITIVDGERSKEGREVYRRVAVPFSIARKFQKHHKTSRYLHPVWTAIIRYGDLVIALERHPLGAMGEMEEEGFDGQTRRWEPFCERSIRMVVVPKTRAHQDWWFDGRYMYRFPQGAYQAVVNGRFLSSDGHFRAINCIAVDFGDLELQSKVEIEEQRVCVAFVADTGDYALTPPVWKTFDIGNRTTDSKTKQQRFDFDEFDQRMAININFALKAGHDLANVFGHLIAEPLELPDLMVRMRTVNLPSIHPDIKATTAIHLSFKNSMAWLIGLLARTDTLDGYLTLRNLLKYLISKGVVRKDALDSSRVFRDDSNTSVSLVTREQAADNAKRTIASGIEVRRSVSTSVRDGGSAIGRIYNEDGTVD